MVPFAGSTIFALDWHNLKNWLFGKLVEIFYLRLDRRDFFHNRTHCLRALLIINGKQTFASQILAIFKAFWAQPHNIGILLCVFQLNVSRGNSKQSSELSIHVWQWRKWVHSMIRNIEFEFGRYVWRVRRLLSSYLLTHEIEIWKING